MVFQDTQLYGDMFSKEDQLPHLPVPDLKQTMEKYIEALEPITFGSELENTKKVVKEFLQPGGLGETLQTKLVEKAEVSDNWLSEWWDRCAYFGNRESVVINSSPAAHCPDRVFYNDVDQFRYVAQLIHRVLGFKKLVDTENIPVDYAGKDPLTMGQHGKLLSACRVPLAKCDDIVYTPPDQSRNVIVAHNNHFFSFDVFREGTDVPLAEEELIQQLAFIASESSEEEAFPVGVLTSESRNNWALTYKRLRKDSRNRSNLDEIEKSICLICLDQTVDIPVSSNTGYEDIRSSVALNQFLHGGGSSQNSMNRWNDKIIQLIVNRNGLNGICYEHCSADGQAVNALCNMLLDINFEPDYAGFVHMTNNNLKPPKSLSWNLTDDIVDKIDLAMDRIDEAANNLDLRSFKFHHFGKNVAKKFNISPDAFFQVCMQLAYWRLHRHHPPTYESASIRNFARGRTECIRSATPAAAQFSREMDQQNYHNAGKRELFIKATQAHVNYTADAINFRAIDRHMLGLKLIALENGMPIPEIFRDKSYRYSTYFKLSSSQLPNKRASCSCFGAVVPDGYGVCYNPMKTQFLYSVSSYLSHPETNSKDFGDAIGKALQDVHLLLSTTPSKL